jgi:Xaa-Pro dipeptidase
MAGRRRASTPGAFGGHGGEAAEEAERMTKGVGGSTAEAELAAIASLRDRVAPITTAERRDRIARAQARMRETGVAALWLDGTTDLEYFTGVRHGQTERMIGCILPASGEPVYLSPAFEVEKLRTLITIGERVVAWQEHDNPFALFVDTLKGLQIGRGTLAIDAQARFFVVDGIRRAAEAAGADYALTPATEIAGWCRARKTPAERAIIAHAMQCTLRVQAAAARILRPGITTTEVAAFLDEAHRRTGFDGGARFALVLFGEASAYPHGVPHAQTLKEGDMVLVDTGGAMHGYVSDITRSYVFGEPSDRQRDVWALEHRAQAAAFAAIRPGVPCGAIDDAARGVINAAGYGPGYATPGLPHRTGHGIGMDVHEAPYFVKDNAEPLAVGVTGSIEPTICIYGAFGVRLEDHFTVTETGAAWLTPPSPSIDDPFGNVA